MLLDNAAMTVGPASQPHVALCRSCMISTRSLAQIRVAGRKFHLEEKAAPQWRLAGAQADGMTVMASRK
jgi:hypothetical protein